MRSCPRRSAFFAERPCAVRSAPPPQHRELGGEQVCSRVAFCVRGFEKLARKQRATAETFGFVLPKPVTKQGDAECYRLGGAGLDFPQGSGMIRTRSKKPSAKSSELELADLYSRLQADFCGLAPRGARQRSSRGSGDWVFNLCVACTKFVTKFFADAAPYEV